MIRSYLQESRAPRYSLLFALPLLIIYQTLAALVPPGPGGVGVRNGADVALETVLFGSPAFRVRGCLWSCSLSPAHGSSRRTSEGTAVRCRPPSWAECWSNR